MRIFIRCFLLHACNFLVCLFFVLPASGQGNQSQRISVDLQGLTIDQFVNELEKRTGTHFYYDPAVFESARLNLRVSEKPLSEALEEAFRNTEFNYAIDNQNHVFLTKGHKILTSFPSGIAPSPLQIIPSVTTTVTPAATTPITPSVTPTVPPPAATIVQDFKIPGTTIESANATPENKLYEIGVKNNEATTKATLAGYIREDKTGEPVAGASVYLQEGRILAVSDRFGYYSVSLPKGQTTLNFRAVGMADTRRQVVIYSDGRLNVEIQQQILSLEEVVISADKSINVKSVQMGVEKLSIQTIKQVPTVFGETDVLKVVLTLPGVKSVGEASGGFNVRGGATDQNLILFNDATVYNPSHFFGFFSAFNADIVKDVELYKSSVPVRYGGRLSSVLDISAREGNKKKIMGSAGLGLLTSRLNLEGPLVKDKTSFILGGRTTYSDWLLNILPDNSGYKGSKASFYDLNLNLNHKQNEKNDLYFTGYLSNDLSNLNTDTLYGYNNKNVSLKWKHIFNNRFTGILTSGYDRYQYNNHSDKDSLNAYKLNFDINQLSLKTDFKYYLNSKHILNFGLSTIHYQLHPGSFNPAGNESLIVPDNLETEQAVESAVYAGDVYDITPKLSVDFGLRYSMFNYLGPQKLYTYAPDLPVTEANKIDSISYDEGSLIKTYHGPELRVSMRYIIANDFSVKAGYNTLRQYIHMLSNTTAIAPTDIWKLSDPHIKPQYGDQVSMGFYKNFKSNTIETSVEVYYKRLKDYLDYKSGAKLILNHHIETDVISTQGKAYGAELMIKKLSGKLNGWMSYTYSRTLLKMNANGGEQLINNGEYYPSNYDKPHDFTVIGNYKFSHRISVSANVTYSTGRPITIPLEGYFYAGSQRALYSDRNSFRIPDYFRSDLSMIIEGNHKIKQLTHNAWTFGVYNLTGRKNAYSIYYISEKGKVSGYKLSIFGSAIPFVNYNIRF